LSRTKLAPKQVLEIIARREARRYTLGTTGKKSIVATAPQYAKNNSKRFL
jgi:hypothetical protein